MALLRALGPTLALCALAEWFIIDAIVSALSVELVDGAPGRSLRHFTAGLLLSHFAFGRLLERTAGLLAARTGERVTDTLRRMAGLDLATFERLEASALIPRLTTDVEEVRSFATGLARMLRAAAALTIGLGYCHALSPTAALIAALVLGVVAVIILVGHFERDAHLGRLAAARDGVQRLVEDAIAGFVQLRQHRPRRRAILGEVRRRSAQLDAERDRVSVAFVETHAQERYLLYFGLAICAWFLIQLEGRSPTAAAPITLLVMYVGLTQLEATRLLPQAMDAQHAWRRLCAALDGLGPAARAPAPPPGRPDALPERPSRVELRGVCYRRPSTAHRAGFELGPIDLILRAGEVVFVTGENGSGKSTFLKVLTGLYRADAGALLVDGRAVGPEDMSAWRSRFASIFSDFALFDRLYGVEAVDPERVRRLLDELQLGHKTAWVDGRFTELELSTGQRKRLAMVAALLRDRPIHVFDEWSAEQDPEYRAWFYDTLLPRLAARGAIVLAVTHDEDFFDRADRVLHFDAGQMVQR